MSYYTSSIQHRKVNYSQVAPVVKNLPANARALREAGSIPGLGRSPGEGKGHPFQYSGLEKSRDCIVYGTQRVDTTERLSLLNYSYITS